MKEEFDQSERWVHSPFTVASGMIDKCVNPARLCPVTVYTHCTIFKKDFYLLKVNGLGWMWKKNHTLQMKDKALKENVRLLKKTINELEETTREVKKKQNQLEEKDTQLENMSKQMSEKERLLESTIREMETSKQQLETLTKELQGMVIKLEEEQVVPDSDFRLVLLGRSGYWKSAAGSWAWKRRSRLEHQQKSTREELRQDVELCLRLSAPGPHAFLLVIPVKESAEEMLEKMEEIFGERCWRNTIILFTVTDEEQKKNIEEFVQSGNQEVHRLVEKCENRFHCLNIDQSGDDSLVSQLMDKIDEMVSGNAETFFSSEIHLQIHEMAKKIVKEIQKIKERQQREISKKLDVKKCKSD
ncbi:hypothetical protein QQF64_026773 [Cirrhinus molitorella]|uniref:AIG1-type G domain-containing protein n=1 Tax=Cirrhinus molitorella TaxID=172907 RepID=A0ABR3NAH6_9TELE